ncbi:MAG: hypothetical protein JOZ14_05085 [Acidobacteria bacterium]|nr:hypothetical protein [Acidobacteriota bacterium]
MDRLPLNPRPLHKEQYFPQGSVRTLGLVFLEEIPDAFRSRDSSHQPLEHF